MNLTYVWQQSNSKGPNCHENQINVPCHPTFPYTKIQIISQNIEKKSAVYCRGFVSFQYSTIVKFHTGINERIHKLKKREGRSPTCGMCFGQNNSITFKPLMSGEYILSLENRCQIRVFFDSYIEVNSTKGVWYPSKPFCEKMVQNIVKMFIFSLKTFCKDNIKLWNDHALMHACNGIMVFPLYAMVVSIIQLYRNYRFVNIK